DAFLVPFEPGNAPPDAVLALHDGAWTREPICLGASPVPCQPPASGFHVVAIDARAPDDAWLLASASAAGDGIVLLARDAATGTWRQRSLGSSYFAQPAPQIAPPQGAAPLAVRIAPRTAGQPLTVADGGVWIDAQLTLGGTARTDATIFYAAAGGGQVAAS